MIYTIIPAVFVIFQAIPIFFYDNVGKKKETITKALQEKRAFAEAEAAAEAELEAEAAGLADAE
jgi:Na+/melibiose symporter-like transporter